MHAMGGSTVVKWLSLSSLGGAWGSLGALAGALGVPLGNIGGSDGCLGGALGGALGPWVALTFYWGRSRSPGGQIQTSKG